MRARSFAMLVAGSFVLGASLIHPAFAIDKPNTPMAPKPTKVSPTNLSESECTQLGGVVATEAIGVCNSHRVCQTKDENGKSHSVCINASR